MEILPKLFIQEQCGGYLGELQTGEPPVHIKDYQKRDMLIKDCKGDGCNYDEVLLTGIKKSKITASKKIKY